MIGRSAPQTGNSSTILLYSNSKFIDIVTIITYIIDKYIGMELDLYTKEMKHELLSQLIFRNKPAIDNY